MTYRLGNCDFVVLTHAPLAQMLCDMFTNREDQATELVAPGSSASDSLPKASADCAGYPCRLPTLIALRVAVEGGQ